MRKNRVVATIRWLIAALGALVVGDSVVVAQTAVGTAATVEFLSSITALTNIIGLIAFAVAGFAAWREVHESPTVTAFRVIAVSYLTSMSGLFLGIYGVVVFGDPASLNVNTIVLHIVIPVLAIAEFVLFPGAIPQGWRLLGVLVIFPVLWFVYTFIRGAATGAYVYEFLNPANVGGNQKVILMTVLILMIFFLVGVFMTFVQRIRTTRGRRYSEA